MKLQFKNLSGYLPYGLKVQYEGIINGKELGAHKKEFEQENDPLPNWLCYEPLEPIYGIKIGFIKKVSVYLNYVKYEIGNKTFGLKPHYSTEKFKPILHPLSDYEKFDEIVLEMSNYDMSIIDENPDMVKRLPYDIIELMFKNHIDIYGLIKEGLAININNLQN